MTHSRWLLAVFLLSLYCPAVPADAPQSQRPSLRIVLLHSADSQLPAIVEGDAAFREVLAASGGTHLEIYPEQLDIIRFPVAAIDDTLTALLRKKYSARPPHVVVAYASPALEFAERHHEELWPGASLIFMVIDEKSLSASRGKHSATGVLMRMGVGNAVELGLRLLPATKRVVLVGGVADWERATMQDARADVARFEGRLAIEYLTDMPFAEILKRVAELPRDSLVITVSLFRDSTGETFVPAEAAARLAKASGAPTLVPYGNWINGNALGGRVIRFADQGHEAAKLVLEILAGRDARTLPVRHPDNPCVVDWRELRRWDIPMGRVPADCEVLYREFTFWEQHWGKMLIAVATILAQALLITILVVQRRHRRLAELESQRQRAQLAHAARLATVGELTASIAHEINQPLGAILSNADAAEILLESEDPNLAEVRQILADIRRDDERASAVIQRLRTLLARNELDRQRLEPNAIVREAIALMSQEADRRGVRLVENLGESLPTLQGDRVHLVQVLISRLITALDAMEASPPGKRQVVVSTSASDAMLEVSVGDAGPGVPAADLSRLFDSFFTTKAKGMGLGLSIARSIIEAHGGKIWAENPTGGGAVFRFRLAAAP